MQAECSTLSAEASSSLWAVAKKAKADKGKTALIRERNNSRVILTAVVVGLVGVVLLYLSGRPDLWKERGAAQALVSQLGALLVTVVALSLLWEFVGKRSFADEVLDKAGLGSDVKAAGLVRITDSYLKEVEWDSLFERTRKLDIVVAYGRTWRQTHWGHLQRIASDPRNRVRILLPDPEDVQSISVLADRFNRTTEVLKADIEEAATEFKSLARPGGADLTVYFRKGDQVFSCYRLDDSAVLTLYSHSRTRTAVPTVVCEFGGSLFSFIRSEIDAMIDNSRVVGTTPGASITDPAPSSAGAGA